MEDVAVNRLATSITQLTLCQVTTDEIDAATKLLDKACQILRGIPDVLPETNNKTTTGDGGEGQVMLSLHDMTGQSWVSHAVPSDGLFFSVQQSKRSGILKRLKIPSSYHLWFQQT